jgi:hypothetical protein
MSTESAKKRPAAAPTPNAKRSGTRLVADRRWPASLDQDLIPTQPENETPPASSELPTLAPPADEDEIRDTLPAPPPDEE